MGANGEVSVDVVKDISIYYGKGSEKAAKCLAQYTTFVRVKAFSQTNLSGRAQHTCLLISGGRFGGHSPGAS